MAPPRARLYCFTFHAYDWTIIELIKGIKHTWLVFQTEKGKTRGTPHLQGVIHFKNPISLRAAKALFPVDSKGRKSVHLEVAIKSPMVNLNYCTKVETRLEDNYYRFEGGQMPAQGQRSDLLAIFEFIRQAPLTPELQLWEQFPIPMLRYRRAFQRFQQCLVTAQSSMPIVTVVYGPTGTGKSHFCQEQAMVLFPEILPYYLPPSTPGGTPWADGYTGQPVVIINDFSGVMPFRTFLQILDKYPVLMQTKGGFTQWSPSHIFISANLHPSKWYPKDDPAYMFGPLRRRLETLPSRIIHMYQIYLGIADPDVE